MRSFVALAFALPSLLMLPHLVAPDAEVVGPRRTHDAALSAADRTVVVYEVSVLVQATLPQPAAEEAPGLPALDATGGLDAARENALAEERRKLLLEETERLGALIGSFLEPRLEQGQQITAAGPGVLVVNASPAQQGWIRAVLELHRSRTVQLDVRTWYLEGPRGSFRGHVPEGTAVLLPTEAERDAFLALEERAEIELLAAPRLLARDRQRATLDVMTQIPYVADWELVVVEPGAQEIADPQIDVLNEGYALDVQALTLPSGAIGLDLGLTRSWVERPIPTRKVRLSASLDQEVEISSPTSHSTSIRSKLVLAPQASVVFLSPSNDEERDLAVVLSVSVVTAPAEVTEER